MQTAPSQAYADAVTAPVNTPVARVIVDFGDGAGMQDVSSRVTSLSVQRSSSTELPEQARLVVGYPAAEAEIILGAGDGVEPVSWTYSPYRLAYTLGGSVTVELGYDEAPNEFVTVFTGFLDSVKTPSHQKVKLTALDGREQMGALVNLPGVGWHQLSSLIYDFPGIDGQWVIDHLLRRSGYYASPPPRDPCVFSATLHGSAMPEIGYLNSVGEIGTIIPGPLVVSGVFGEALRPQPNPAEPDNSRLTWFVNDGIELDSPNSLDVEGWFNTGGHDSGVFLVMVGNTNEDSVVLSVFGGVLYVDVRRWDGAAQVRSFHTANLAIGPGWHYCAARVIFHADGTYRQWHRVDGQTGGPFDDTNAPIVADNTVNAVIVGRPENSADTNTAAEAVLVHNPQSTGDVEPVWWNDAYTGNVTLPPSLTNLAGTPEASDQIEAWRVAQDVAAAEFGTFGFDEHGHPYFRNRNWVFDNPDSVAVQRTLTATGDITVLAAKLDTTQQHGSVTLSATPYVPTIDTAMTWSASERHRLDGDLAVDVALDAPILAPDSTFTQMTTNEPADGSGSQYRANTARDGSGTVISAGFSLLLAPDRVRITSSSTGGWLVGTDGKPALHFHTNLIKSAGKSTIVKTSDPTIQGMTLPDNPWRQRVLGLDYVVADLADDLATIRPVLTNVEVIADPRLQLTDRVALQDSTGLALDAQLWTEALELDFAPGELTQRLSLRGTRAAFDPRDVADLSMWFDARWPDGNEASAPPADGSAVSSWTDLVGANAVTQATATAQPTFAASATLTGQPAIRFDGADDYLAGTIPTTGNPLTAFAVVGYRGPPSGDGDVPFGIDPRVLLTYENASNLLVLQANVTDAIATYLPRGAGFMLVEATWASGGRADLWINGVKEATRSVGSASGTSLSVGCHTPAGGPADFFGGDVSALLVYDRLLGAVERQKIENYLARIFGVVLWKQPGGTG